MNSLEKTISGLLDEGKTVTLSGGPGSGKSTFVKQQLGKDREIKFLAPTNLAAALLGGETIFSGLSVSVDRPTQKSIYGAFANIGLKGYRWVVIDEAFMIPGSILDKILKAKEQANDVLKANKRSPLGLLLVGDPAQLLAIGEDPFYKSEINSCQYRFGLKGQYRQSNTCVNELISEIREGKVSSIDTDTLISITSSISSTNQVSNSDSCFSIACSNKEVEALNGLGLLETPGELLSIDSKSYTFNYKLGAPVFLKEALLCPRTKARLLAKGTPGVIRGIDANKLSIEVEKKYVGSYVPGPNNPRISISPELLQLAFAGNVHTVQGQTRKNICVHYHSNIARTHGASLVAITRHTNELSIEGSNTISFYQDPNTFPFIVN